MLWIKHAMTTVMLTVARRMKHMMTTVMLTVMQGLSAIALVGCVTLGFVPFGCSSHLGPVTAKQDGDIDHPNFPDMTIEQFKACVAEHGKELEPGYHKLNSKVEVNEDGGKEDVTIEDLPYTAHDFGACMRIALQDMAISEHLLREAQKKLHYQREQASAAQRTLMSSPVVVVVGVTIIVTEVVLEAGAYTILFATTVSLIDKAAKDVAELAKGRPNKHDRCVAQCLHLLPSPSGDLQSSEYRKCYRECMGRL